MRRTLILASASPRRRALLSALGLEFSVAAAEIDEKPYDGEAPDALVVRLSQTKAAAMAARYREADVLAADTVVVLGKRILGKPADAADAMDMLKSLRERAHQVYTAVSLVHDGGQATRLSCSNVWMRSFSDDEIRRYVETGDPMDKAGAYAIQHAAFAPVDHWDGCYTGIMGLPLGIVAELMRVAGIEVTVGVTAICEEVSGRCCLRGGRGGC